jgi:hypothetical protein
VRPLSTDTWTAQHHRQRTIVAGMLCFRSALPELNWMPAVHLSLATSPLLAYLLCGHRRWVPIRMPSSAPLGTEALDRVFDLVFAVVADFLNSCLGERGGFDL